MPLSNTNYIRNQMNYYSCVDRETIKKNYFHINRYSNVDLIETNEIKLTNNFCFFYQNGTIEIKLKSIL